MNINPVKLWMSLKNRCCNTGPWELFMAFILCHLNQITGFLCGKKVVWYFPINDLKAFIMFMWGYFVTFGSCSKEQLKCFTNE